MISLIPINNSDTAWLIMADYNQDNDIGYPDYLREDIYNPSINQWHWEDYATFKHFGEMGFAVGGIRGNEVGYDNIASDHVGGGYWHEKDVGGIKYSSFVGGYRFNWTL